MANTPSTNYVPTFMKAATSADQVDVTTGTVMPAALDNHDHTANKGLAVGRLLSGVNGSLPAAGHAGAVYVSTDTVTTHIDDGAAWHYHPTIIKEITGDGAITSFDFTSIPSGFRSLELIVYARSAVNGSSDAVQLQFNGDTGANYQQQSLVGTNTGLTLTPNVGQPGILMSNVPGATATANYFGSMRILIPNYANATGFKEAIQSGLWFTAAAVASLNIAWSAGQWLSTAAITRVTLTFTTGPIVTGSVASLYGS